MATRRRTSAVKPTTARKSPKTVVKKSTVTPIKSVNKVTPKIEEVKVTETTDKIEVKLPEGTNLKKRPMNSATASKDKVTRSLTQLDGFELILLPLLYLEDFAKRLINNQF